MSTKKKKTIEKTTECGESKLELIFVDRARVVLVEAAETLLPIVDVLPERGELFEIDRSRTISIEHANHHTYVFRFNFCHKHLIYEIIQKFRGNHLPDCFGIKWRPGAVRQG